MARDSSKRCSTASTTSSTEHAHIESCAAFWTTPVHAISNRRAGQESTGWNRAAKGSARRLELPLGNGCGLLDVDPVGRHAHQTLALHPERSSPVQLTRSFGGSLGKVLGERRDLDVEVVLDGIGLGHDASEPGLRFLVVGAVHEEQAVDQEAPDLFDVIVRYGRTRALASSPIAAPFP